jgi:NADH-quinone oxidoreductase subunit L
MAWFVPLVPLLAAPVFFLLGRGWGRAAWATSAAGTALVCFLLACLAVSANWEGTYSWSDRIILQLGITPLSAVFAITVPAIASAVIAFAAWHEPIPGLPRLLPLLLVFTGAMELLVLAMDFLTLLIAWEIVGACSWALINHEWQEKGNAQDAGWAFLVTRLGDLGLFIAVFVVFSATGSFAYSSLGSLNGGTLSLFTAGILLAAVAKSAQLPFSPWLFSAMAGPAPVSALLHAATMVAAGVYILVRLHTTLANVAWFEPMVIGIGLATALVAGLVASTQFHAKKLLAASTSTHYGLMFIAIGAGYPGIATLHFVAHAAMKAPLFLIAGVTGAASGGYDLKTMALGRTLPKIAIASLIASVALAGMFPLGAAWTKEKIITAAGHAAPWLAMLTIVAGALSAVYAARFQFHAFSRANTPSSERRASVSLWESSAIFTLTLLTLLISLLWLPAVAHLLENPLNLHFPPFKLWELASSLALVMAGGVFGFWLTRKPAALETRTGKLVANWLAIPEIGKWLVVSPVLSCGRTLARADDHIIDRAFMAAAAGIQWLAGSGTRLSETVFDRIPGEIATAVQWLARLGTRLGEQVFDQLPSGLASSTGKAGTLTRKLQTGMSHQYYAFVAVGVASLIVILILGDAF